jgi:hypothetical protein
MMSHVVEVDQSGKKVVDFANQGIEVDHVSYWDGFVTFEGKRRGVKFRSKITNRYPTSLYVLITKEAKYMGTSVDYTDHIKLYVLAHDKITNRECRKLLGTSYNETIRILSRLCELGVLERIGVGSGTKYIFPLISKSARALETDEQSKQD